MPFLFFFLALCFLIGGSNCEKFAEFVGSLILFSVILTLILWPVFIVAIFGAQSWWFGFLLTLLYLWSNHQLIYRGRLNKVFP